MLDVKEASKRRARPRGEPLDVHVVPTFPVSDWPSIRPQRSRLAVVVDSSPVAGAAWFRAHPAVSLLFQQGPAVEPLSERPWDGVLARPLRTSSLNCLIRDFEGDFE